MKEIKQVVLIKRKEKDLERNKNEKERKRILNNFYTKEIKSGKTIRADYLDKAFLMVFTFFITTIWLNKLINNFIISLFIGIVISFIMNNYLKKKIISQRKVKIEEIKKEYKFKLEEEGLISPKKDIEDYIVESYYKNKDEIKSNINVLGKDKILKLLLLL